MSPFDTTNDAVEASASTPSAMVSGSTDGPVVPRPLSENFSTVDDTDGGVTTLGVTKPSAVSTVRLGELRALSQLREAQTFVQVVERWQGVVEEVDDESFEARVISVGGVAEWPEEEGRFPMSLVSQDDLELVKPGAYFTYTVARETRFGTRSSVSVLTFRRMPVWHLRQIADAKLKGLKIAQQLAEHAKQDIERTARSATGD